MRIIEVSYRDAHVLIEDLHTIIRIPVCLIPARNTLLFINNKIILLIRFLNSRRLRCRSATTGRRYYDNNIIIVP